MRCVFLGVALVALAAPAAATVPPVGPGPTNYTVQPQPAAGSCHYWYSGDGAALPDPSCTPGALSPTVKSTNLGSTICKAGYPASVRPPAEIIQAEKQKNAESYGYTGDLRQAEYDHLVPLELGGDPNDPRNLWVEPQDPGSAAASVGDKKNGVEHQLNALVCSGKMTLTAAQEAIAHDWAIAVPQ